MYAIIVADTASRDANNLLIDNLLYPKIGHEYGRKISMYLSLLALALALMILFSSLAFWTLKYDAIV